MMCVTILVRCLLLLPSLQTTRGEILIIERDDGERFLVENDDLLVNGEDYDTVSGSLSHIYPTPTVFLV